MDNAVEQVARDFDRVMTLKYAKRWEKMGMLDDEEDADDGKGFGGAGAAGAAGEGGADDGDRIQKIVEIMERLNNQEPEFMDRVKQDMERMRN